MMKVKKVAIIFVGFIFIIMVNSVWAQEAYPNKPIQIIIPWAAGGSADISTRLTGEKMAEHLGQPVIMVNKPGGGGAIGINSVVTSKPDGYTLLLIGAGLGALECLVMMNPHISFKVSDFIPIAAFAKMTYLAAVHKDLPVKTFPELVDYTIKNPGTLSYSSTGVGGTGHLLFELLKSTHKGQLDIQHVPYTGLAPALIALLGGHSQVSILANSSLITKHVESGAIRALAVFSTKRFPFLPQVPTAIEQGFPEMFVETYFAYYAPAKTPAHIVKKLEAALEKAIQDKGLREKIEKMELAIDFKNSEDLQTFLDNTIKKWEPVIKAANIILK